MTENNSLDSIPESALAVYKRNNEFSKYCANLDLIAAWYNKICLTVLEVEYPLIKDQLDVINIQLKQAEDQLNWNSKGLYKLES